MQKDGYIGLIAKASMEAGRKSSARVFGAPREVAMGRIARGMDGGGIVLRREDRQEWAARLCSRRMVRR